VNRLLQSVSRSSQEFANAAAAVNPLVQTLLDNAERVRDAHFAARSAMLQSLQGRAHSFDEESIRSGVFTPVHASTAAWSDTVWSGFAPPSGGIGIPRLTRVGEISRDVTLPEAPHAQPVTIPALVPIIGKGGLVLLAEGKQLDAARDVLQAIAVRMIAALPPGLLRLTLVDHLGVGNNFALLTPFHEVIRGPMMWHDPRQIASALDALIEHMAMVTQKYLKTQYRDIEAYNAAQGVVEEPYRVLAIANFPAGLDINTAKQVISIAQNGPRSGMYVIVSVDRKAAMPHGLNLADLTRFCTVLEGTVTSGFVWRPNVHELSENAARWATDILGRGRVVLDEKPPTEIVEAIAGRTDKLAADKRSVQVPFERMAHESWWKAATDGERPTTAEGISVPIGRRGSEDQLFELSRGADAVHHALIGGKTGSGKSVLFKVLITSLCTRYSPSELELYLVDFKGGVEFQIFSELRHARVVAIDSEREFGLSVLDGLLKEKSEREAKFKAAEVKDIVAYRKSGGAMSRILLIVDEFQKFFEATDRIASRARAALDDLARVGRSFGIHVILASQSISSSAGGELESGTLNQFGLRIALTMNESDSRRILSKDNDAAKYLSRAGEAIFNAKNGLVEGNIKFQVAHIDDAEVTEQLRRVNEQSDRAEKGRKPRVFEGNRAATIRDNAKLVSAILDGPPSGRRFIPAYLGEPAQISDDHTFVKMRRQSGDNLLLLGQHDDTMFSIFTTAVTSWAVHQSPQSAQIFVFNLANIDDPLFDQFDFFRTLPQSVRVIRNRDVIATIAQIAETLEERLKQDEDAPESARQDNILLAFYGFQRARDLVRDGMAVKPVVKQLNRIFHDGPENGIATILAGDTHGNTMRILEPKDLNEFGARVAVIGSDSGKILGEHASSFKVREHYGVLYELERPDLLMKFRTYGLDQLDWLKKHFA